MALRWYSTISYSALLCSALLCFAGTFPLALPSSLYPRVTPLEWSARSSGSGSGSGLLWSALTRLCSALALALAPAPACMGA